MSKRVGKILSFVVAVLMIGAISYLGVSTYRASHAATGASIYLTPDSGSGQAGSTLSVTIREDSGSTPVNSVQASLNYNPDRLEYVSMTEGDVFPIIAANSTSTPGVIRVGRANSDKNISGDHPLVTITFKLIGSEGSGAISVDKAFSLLVRSSDSKDILQNVGSGSYTVTATGGTSSPASTKPVLSMNPSSGQYAVGSTIAVDVRLNSFSTAITTVQAAVSYPTNQLQYVGVSDSGAFSTKQRTNDSAGVVDIIRGVPGGGAGVIGDNAVVTLNFKVIGSTGTALLSVGPASAAFDDSGTGQNVLDKTASTGATYTIGGSAIGSASSSDQTIVTPSQALSIGSKDISARVAIMTQADGTVVTQMAGKVSLSPVIDPSITGADPSDTISKVEYYLDNKLLATQKSTPFTHELDSATVRNGTYTLSVKTYYESGTVDTRSDELLINNKVNLTYVMRHYTVNLVSGLALLLVLVFVMIKLVLPRLSHLKPQTAAAATPTTDHDALYGFSTPPSAIDTGPIAQDPTVVAPTNQPAPAILSDIIRPVSNATQTTAALPMNEIAPAALATPIMTQAVIAPSIPTSIPTPTPKISKRALLPSRPEPDPVTEDITEDASAGEPVAVVAKSITPLEPTTPRLIEITDSNESTEVVTSTIAELETPPTVVDVPTPESQTEAEPDLDLSSGVIPGLVLPDETNAPAAEPVASEQYARTPTPPAAPPTSRF